MKPKRGQIVTFMYDGRSLVGKVIGVGAKRCKVRVNAVEPGSAVYDAVNAHVDPYEDDVIAEFNLHQGPILAKPIKVEGCLRC